MKGTKRVILFYSKVFHFGFINLNSGGNLKMGLLYRIFLSKIITNRQTFAFVPIKELSFKRFRLLQRQYITLRKTNQIM